MMDCKVYHAGGDADCLIVKQAIESALTKETILVGEDTDLLILLIYFADLKGHKIYLKSETKQYSKRKMTLLDIQLIKKSLGLLVCTNILFIHSIARCDTTSALFGIGKSQQLTLFKDSVIFREQAKVFDGKFSSKEEIIVSGERALVTIYKGHHQEELNALRFNKFSEKISKCHSQVEPKMLPPTSDAAKYHSLHVYYQVREWKGDSHNIDPLEWGWELINNRLMPKYTDSSYTPEYLLTIIKCSYKTGCIKFAL